MYYCSTPAQPQVSLTGQVKIRVTCTHDSTWILFSTEQSSSIHVQGEKERERERDTGRDMSRHQGHALFQLAPSWRAGTHAQTHTHISWRQDRRQNTGFRARVPCEEIQLHAFVLFQPHLPLFGVSCLFHLAVPVDGCSSFARRSAPLPCP